MAVAVAERDPPVRVLVAGPGDVLRPAVADRVRERDTDEPGLGAGQVGVERHGELVRAGQRPVRDQPLPHQGITPLRQHLPRGIAFCLFGLGQHPQPRPHGHLIAGAERGHWRHVVGAHRRHAVAPPVLRGQRRPVGLAGEPEHGGAHDPAGRQVLADPAVDGAEVLADGQRPGPGRLPGQRGHRGPVVVADVRAAVGRPAHGHAPQPHQPHHVVDPQPAAVPEPGSEQLVQRAVAGGGQPPRVPGRLRPVLPALVELVRRRAHRQAADQQVLVRPGVRPAGVGADRKVADDPGVHARGQRRPLRGGQLLISEPLQPGVELGIRAGGRGRAARITVRARPVAPVGPVPLGERAPGGPVLELAALALAEPLVLAAPGLAERHPVDDFQRRPLGRPDRVPVDERRGGVAGQERGGERLDPRPLRGVQPAVLGDVLDPQVERADVAPGHRQVRGVADRRQRLGGVQRVDQYEAGAQVAGAPGGQVGQVAQIAVTPRLAGADRVELDGEPPGPAVRDPGPGEPGLAAGFLAPAGPGGAGHAVERVQDRGEGLRAHLDFLVARVPVAGRDPGGLGAPDQLRVRPAQ